MIEGKLSFTTLLKGDFMKRLFIGLQIPENVIQTLGELPTELTGALWKTPDKYHLTLEFVGNVEEPMADEIERELKYIRFPAFQRPSHTPCRSGTLRSVPPGLFPYRLRCS